MTGLPTDAQYRLLKRYHAARWGPVALNGSEFRTRSVIQERQWLADGAVTDEGREALRFYETHWQVPGWETASERYGVRP